MTKAFSRWNYIQINKIPKLSNPIFISGLPGIGNVGKIAADILIEQLDLVKFLDITSITFPHSVFVNEDNLVDLPMMEVFYKKFNDKKKSDLIILTGDCQPMSEEACYEFCNQILQLAKKLQCKEIVTTGGIGLQETQNPPRVYCTGTNKKIIEVFLKDKPQDYNLSGKISGIVGPIVGVTGVLLGIAKHENMNAVALLAETIAHPLYVGIKGSREIVKVLNTQYSLGINIDNIDKEIKNLEKQAKRTRALRSLQQQAKQQETLGQDYIG